MLLEKGLVLTHISFYTPFEFFIEKWRVSFFKSSHKTVARSADLFYFFSLQTC